MIYLETHLDQLELFFSIQQPVSIQLNYDSITKDLNLFQIIILQHFENVIYGHEKYLLPDVMEKIIDIYANCKSNIPKNNVGIIEIIAQLRLTNYSPTQVNPQKDQYLLCLLKKK